MATVWVAVLLLLAATEDPLLTTEKLIAEGKYQQALALLAPEPASFRRHLLASKAYDGLNDPARAVEQAEAALNLDPRSEAAHLQLGQIFLGHNTPQAAADVFGDALQLHPESFLLRLGRGLAWKDLMRYEEAEADLRICLSRRPDFPIAFDALATVYLQGKRFEDLQTLADAFRARNPKDYRGPYFAAAARDGGKTGDPAIDPLLDESIRLNPNFAASHALVGKRKLAAGDIAAAIPSLEQALRLRPGYSPAALHLAQSYQKAGRTADAANAFRRVREIKEKEQTPPPSLTYHRGK
jgi:tetratricopeptide (TPR) repeat protein